MNKFTTAIETDVNSADVYLWKQYQEQKSGAMFAEVDEERVPGELILAKDVVLSTELSEEYLRGIFRSIERDLVLTVYDKFRGHNFIMGKVLLRVDLTGGLRGDFYGQERVVLYVRTNPVKYRAIEIAVFKQAGNYVDYIAGSKVEPCGACGNATTKRDSRGCCISCGYPRE